MNFFVIWLSFFGMFSFFYIDDSQEVNIIGDYVFDEYTVEYGEVMTEDIDGIYIIIDNETKEEINRYIYDGYGNERFLYLADIGNDEFLIVCERYDNNGEYGLPTFKDMLIMKFNMNGDLLAKKMIDEEPLNYYNHNSYLILSYGVQEIILDSELQIVDEISIAEEYVGEYTTSFQGKAIINGKKVNNIKITYPGHYDIIIENENYMFSYSITVHPVLEIIGDEFNDVYTGKVLIKSEGEIFINSNPIESNSYINYPGYYTIYIKGTNGYVYSESLTIVPILQYSTQSSDIIESFTDEMVFSEGVTLYSDGVSMTLNGETYSSEIILEADKYIFMVYGVNGMSFELSFIIAPRVDGLIDLGVYEKVEFYVFGLGLLNGKLVEGEIMVDTPGEYRLDLLLENQIYKTYQFTIDASEILEENDVESSFNFNYIFIGVILVGTVLFLRKK